jgi:hypothetical protein
LPGPTDYKITSKWLKTSPITIKSRKFMYYEEDIKKRSHCISPQKYNIKDNNFMKNSRFLNIGIGIGLGYRSWSKMYSNNIPGPGQYNLPSVFDKNRKFKYALN